MMAAELVFIVNGKISKHQLRSGEESVKNWDSHVESVLETNIKNGIKRFGPRHEFDVKIQLTPYKGNLEFIGQIIVSIEDPFAHNKAVELDGLFKQYGQIVASVVRTVFIRFGVDENLDLTVTQPFSKTLDDHSGLKSNLFGALIPTMLLILNTILLFLLIITDQPFEDGISSTLAVALVALLIVSTGIFVTAEISNSGKRKRDSQSSKETSNPQ